MSDDLLQKTKQKLREAGFTTMRSVPRGGVYVFFSFDLVNSTAYKVAFPDKWPLVVIHFYELVQAEITTRFNSTVLWKYVGDEILYYFRVAHIAQLYELLPGLLSALRAVIASLYSFDPRTRQILSVKSAAWIAEANYLPSTSVEQQPSMLRRNIITTVQAHTERAAKDFLGPDIDAGFRISRFVERNRLVVSAHLAGLLFEERENCPEIEKRLKIVSYESLKGVWDGRRYPIVWYEEDWERIEDSFLYDEHLNSDLVAKIRITKVEGQEHELKNIHKVFDDLGKLEELNCVLGLLREQPATIDDEVVEIEVPLHKRSEVHCVAACFDKSGKVLLAKRPSTKKRFPGKWELGCSQLQLGETFEECLKNAYRRDFAAELDLPSNPIPVASFSIEDEGERRRIPGVIFAAFVTNPESVEGAYLREKHTEIRWLDPHSDEVQADDCVPGLLENVRKAWIALQNQ